MRNDSIGLFWEDIPKRLRGSGEAKKVALKRQPPAPVWLSPDYLPHLNEAEKFDYELFTIDSLLEEKEKNIPLIFDIEVYPNYFCIAFMSNESGRVMYFEKDNCNLKKLKWVIDNFLLISFNGIKYDSAILALILAGKSEKDLRQASSELIEYGEPSWKVLKDRKVNPVFFNHIDLIEVAPLFGSLKIYGGRLHTGQMQDLPFPPDSELSENQIKIVRWYCINDLKHTDLLFNSLKERIELRVSLSNKYKIDLRSKSDAQIAEAVISKEIYKRLGFEPEPPEIEENKIYKYRCPDFIEFETEKLKSVLQHVKNVNFITSINGNIPNPQELKDYVVEIGNSRYNMGIGGLHSMESCVTHFSDEENLIIDYDVASYYPSIILNLGLFPKHLTKGFLTIYKKIVDRRLEAKKAGDKITSESLKITINGSFGKFGNAFSKLYSPDLLMQVTVTGQLCILMLIEKLELAGFSVLSANTDGITAKIEKSRKHISDKIIADWQGKTGFILEDTIYKMICHRDVNNYIAVKEKGIKTKGIFSYAGLSKNPANEICIDAISEFLTTGASIEKTITECRDFTKFVTVRTVKGGAVKNGEYLGQAIRWYYAKDEEGEIVYAKSGNKVPRTDCAKPVMTLPKFFPNDINYDWYIKESQDMLKSAGWQF